MCVPRKVAGRAGMAGWVPRTEGGAFWCRPSSRPGLVLSPKAPRSGLALPAGGDDGAHSGGGDEEGFAAHGAEEPFPKEGAFDDFASLDGVEGTVEGEGWHGFSTGLVGATGPRVAGGGAGAVEFGRGGRAGVIVEGVPERDELVAGPVGAVGKGRRGFLANGGDNRAATKLRGPRPCDRVRSLYSRIPRLKFRR